MVNTHKDCRYSICLLLRLEPMTVRYMNKILKIGTNRIYEVTKILISEGTIVRTRVKGIWVYHYKKSNPLEALVLTSSSSHSRHYSCGRNYNGTGTYFSKIMNILNAGGKYTYSDMLNKGISNSTFYRFKKIHGKSIKLNEEMIDRIKYYWLEDLEEIK